jgi:CheY-like chemotaxis protein
LAAVTAIMNWGPQISYPGASYVGDALDFLIRSHGVPKALVGHPRAEIARQMAGFLAEIGYDADIATDARSLVRQAIASADYELVVIDFMLAAPVSGEVVGDLRRDSRTAMTPIAIIAWSDELARADELARRHLLVAAVDRPINATDMQRLKTQLLALAGRSFVPAAERLQQAMQSLDIMSSLLAADRNSTAVRPAEGPIVAALSAPQLTPTAITILAGLGTATAQRSLVDLASDPLQPLEQRQAGAKAFAESVHWYGTMLTSTEIVRQYERYNESETQAKETQQVLASILDTIEARAKQNQSQNPRGRQAGAPAQGRTLEREP